ncbi:MAG: tRNA (adenosine(37)-N6)-dimethylallyltransferase MiaA [Desulfobacteraceae bacterium 4572_88]|nr:MAG: tRNA (adenosine(37)-N6)-dimethylallyltransferase MiaA [Desulfobacteraceae bacterium 4572_88]
MISDTQKPKVIVICGPTGIGKTSVAISLAKTFNGEIISADSMQIYRHMDIGTAKPTPAEQGSVPHHLIDVADPDEAFDAVRFAAMAREKIMSLHQQNIPAFVAGGTGFYIKALIHGLFPGKSSDTDIRRRLKAELDSKGTDFLYQQLCACDPATAERLHPNDSFRIIRAIEVYESTGKRMSECHHTHGFSDAWSDTLKIGLCMDRKAIYERINQRSDTMIAEGLEAEVRKLLDMGYTADLRPMQSIGYRHMAGFIGGHLSWEEMVRTLKRDTRRYAKRQMTWFRADSEIVWKEAEQFTDIPCLVDHHLNQGQKI